MSQKNALYTSSEICVQSRYQMTGWSKWMSACFAWSWSVSVGSKTGSDSPSFPFGKRALSDVESWFNSTVY